MKKYLLVLLLGSFIANTSQASVKKILVSIYPLGSLVKMIISSEAEVEVLQKQASCPHHYSIKPSQASMIKNSDYIIYIDSKFELYLGNYLALSQGKWLEIAKYIGSDVENFHFWIDKVYAIRILGALKEYFISEGFNAKILTQNYEEAVARISECAYPQVSNCIIAGESLAYIHKDNSIYVPRVNGLKSYNEIASKAKSNKYKCLIYDPSNNIGSLSNIIRTVALDIEDWDLGDIDISDYYIEYIENINNKIYECISETKLVDKP